MPLVPEQFDFFVAYARKDDASGWITRFIEELLAEHRKFTGNDPALTEAQNYRTKLPALERIPAWREEAAF